MLEIRKSAARGHANHGWLDTFHTFSFADYHDAAHMGFRCLRVINDDRIAGGKGFGLHPHDNMEIVTYVVEGALAHKDTLGTTSVILPGEVQIMTAGTGIRHSEFNQKTDQTTRLLQIWILPDERDQQPGYGQKSFAEQINAGNLTHVVSKDGRQGSLRIHQDVDLYVGKWSTAKTANFALRSPQRFAWIQIVTGDLRVSGQSLGAGDGLAIGGVKDLTLESPAGVEFLLFDLP